MFEGIYCKYTFFEYPELRKNFILPHILKNLFGLIQTKTLDPRWGGYLLVPFGDQLLISNFTLYDNGSYARLNAEPLLHLNYPYNNSNNHECEFIEYQTYEQYASRVPAQTGGDYEIQFNNMIPAENLTDEFINTWIEFLTCYVDVNMLNSEL